MNSLRQHWPSVQPWLSAVVRVFLGAVWIWASLSKISEPRTFLIAVRAYDATPEWLSQTIAYGLPTLEFCIGAVLVLGVAVRIAAAVSAVLFVVFLVGIIQASARGIQLECGCFGGGGVTQGSTAYTWDILRDVGLLILAVYLTRFAASRLSAEDFFDRTDHPTPPSAKRMRDPKTAKRYNALLEMKQAQARNRDRWVGASVAVLIVLISVIGIGVQSGRAKIQGNLTAAHATVADGVTFGKAAPATVDIFEDFQCPNCENFETAAGSAVDAAVTAGQAQVNFHTMAFLDASSSGNRYSSRAANAALCASDVSVADFIKYHNLLYGKVDGKAVQPAEGTNGRPDSDFISYGKQIGLTATQQTTFQSCVIGQTHAALVEALTNQASKDGVTGTPTIRVNGKALTSPTKAAFVAAVAAANKKT